MDDTQAAAILRKAGIFWPHVSHDDINKLVAGDKTTGAIIQLLSGVPDDDELKLVVRQDDDGNVLEEKLVQNPHSMYKRLGFVTRESLSITIQKNTLE